MELTHSSSCNDGDTVRLDVNNSSYDKGDGTLQQDPLVPVKQPWKMSNWFNIGDMSNVVTFVIMVLGILLQFYHGRTLISRYILAFGLFGFAGGITNWLAVKMLFDRVPGLLGSGVIPRRFKEIRQAIKDSVLEMFFDKAFLKKYLSSRSKELLISLNLGAELRKVLTSPDFDSLFVEKLTLIASKPEGMMLQTMAQMFGGVPMMAGMMKPMLVSFGVEMVDAFLAKFNTDSMIDVDKLRVELELLMDEKLQYLTPEKVKEILEHVIRQHLGWLVVWGNFFGGLIGVIAVLAGYQG